MDSEEEDDNDGGEVCGEDGRQDDGQDHEVAAIVLKGEHGEVDIGFRDQHRQEELEGGERH